MSRQASLAIGLAVADGVVLVALRPSSALLRGLRHPDRWIERVGPDAAGAALAQTALWLCAAWLAVGLVAAAGRRLPGLGGRIAEHVCAATLPRAVRRVVAGSAGLGVLLAPLPALGAASGASSVPMAAVTASTTATPSPAAPTWPTAADPPPTTPSSTPSGTPTSPPAETPTTPPSPTPTAPPSTPTPPTSTPAPATPSSPAGAPSTDRPRTTTPTAGPTPPAARPDHGRPATVPVPTWPSSEHRPSRRSATTPSVPDRTTTVRPGDCLWLIAARRLGPGASDAAIAAAWPRWYAANRHAIGADPALIRPGQVLHAPQTTSQEAKP